MSEEENKKDQGQAPSFVKPVNELREAIDAWMTYQERAVGASNQGIEIPNLYEETLKLKRRVARALDDAHKVIHDPATDQDHPLFINAMAMYQESISHFASMILGHYMQRASVLGKEDIFQYVLHEANELFNRALASQ